MLSTVKLLPSGGRAHTLRKDQALGKVKGHPPHIDVAQVTLSPPPPLHT